MNVAEPSEGKPTTAQAAPPVESASFPIVGSGASAGTGLIDYTLPPAEMAAQLIVRTATALVNGAGQVDAGCTTQRESRGVANG